MLVMLREHADVVLRSREGRSRLHGPPEGQLAPRLDGDLLAGPAWDSNRARVVVFMSTACQPCRSRRPEVSAFALDQAADVDTAVCCSGPLTEIRIFAEELSPAVSVIADHSGDTSAVWRVFMTPFAVGIGSDGTVLGKVANPGYDNLLLLSRLLVREGASPMGTEA